MQNQRFITTIGIEYTFAFDGWLDKAIDYEDVAMAAKNLNGNIFDLAHDDGCLEVPTPIIKNWRQLKQFHNKLYSYTEQMGLVTHPKDDTINNEMIQNGMGHIHVGYPNFQHERYCSEMYCSCIQREKNRFVEIWKRDYTHRPYINWVFNHWMDDHNAVNNGFTGKYDSKYAGLHALYDTLELRFFDAKRDWQETQDHVNFALAYFKFIKDKFDNNLIIKKKHRWTQSGRNSLINHYTTPRSAWSEFRRFLRELGLPLEPYKKYYDLNLKPRYEKGKLV